MGIERPCEQLAVKVDAVCNPFNSLVTPLLDLVLGNGGATAEASTDAAHQPLALLQRVGVKEGKAGLIAAATECKVEAQLDALCVPRADKFAASYSKARRVAREAIPAWRARQHTEYWCEILVVQSRHAVQIHNAQPDAAAGLTA